MRDIKGAFQRTGEISREASNKTSGWLEDFAEQMYLKEQTTKTASLTKEARAVTAVEVARNQRTQAQPSIYEMMSAIVSGHKPKFSSVEEAVKDYQERTGLAQYLKAQENERMAAYAALVTAQAEEPEIPVADGQLPVIDSKPQPIGPATNIGHPVGPATNIGTPVGPSTNTAERMSADDGDEDDDDDADDKGSPKTLDDLIKLFKKEREEYKKKHPQKIKDEEQDEYNELSQEDDDAIERAEEFERRFYECDDCSKKKVQ